MKITDNLKKQEFQKDKGLTKTEKLTFFFFGIILILITGTRVFYNFPGNAIKKKQTLIYYILGILFWISFIFIIISIFNF